MKRHFQTLVTGAVFALALSLPALGVDNLLTDPGFEGPPLGTGWGNWGNTDFNNFFGPDVHASLYGDWLDNNGGVFQQGIAGLPGTEYQLVLFNTRLEPNWDADLYCGFEYYDVDDGTKLGETMTLLDTAARLANLQYDGNVFTVRGTAVDGTAFVRPVFRFDNVNAGYFGESQANTFVFNTFMSVAPAMGADFLMNGGFEDLNADGTYGDYWGKWGNTDFNAFFGANGHASFFADTIGNSGGVYQQGILGAAGHRYLFGLLDVRIEDNWDADLYCGLEYYGGDDFVKLGETSVLLDTSQPGNGLTFSVAGIAVAGTEYVRPFIRFDNVRTSGGSLRNAFVFGAGLTETPIWSPGDMNCDGAINGQDIDGFILVLFGTPPYDSYYAWTGIVNPPCDAYLGDMNGDGAVNGQDIDGFVAALFGG